MRHPFLPALLLLWALPAAAQRDITFLYGPERGREHPNAAQCLNRHFTLLENALLHLVLIEYPRDAQADWAMAAFYLNTYARYDERGELQNESEAVAKWSVYYGAAGQEESFRAALTTVARQFKKQREEVRSQLRERLQDWEWQRLSDRDVDERTLQVLMQDLPVQEKSGYYFDRKALHLSAWRGYEEALAPMKEEERERERLNTIDTPLDPSPAAAFASALRAGALAGIADSALREGEARKDDLTSLTEFESDLLFGYLKWVPDVEEVMRGWLSVVIPQTPEDLYLHELRVANCRALLRSELKRYRAQPPSGVQDPEAQYREVAALARALLDNDRGRLDPLYAAAGMTPPVKPVPMAETPDRERPEAVPFVYRFSDQEQAALTYLLLAADTRADFLKDQAAADSASPMEPLVAKWRGLLRSRISEHLSAPGEASQAADPLDRLPLFESVYLQRRLERIDPRLVEELKRLGRSAREEEGKGDAGAGQRLLAALRPLLQRDLELYVESQGRSPDTALKAWAEAALTPGASFAALFPKPPDRTASVETPEEERPAEKPPLAQAVAGLLSDPVEQALVLYLAESADDQSTLLAAIEAGRAGELRQRATRLLEEHLRGPVAGLTAFLQSRGLGSESLLDYYCPRLASSSAPGDSALEELKALAQDLGVLPAAPDQGVAASPPGTLTNRCLGHLRARKERDLAGSRRTEFKPSLALREGWEEVPDPAPASGEGGSGNSDRGAGILGGAAAGWFAAGLFAAMLGLGLGPFFFVAVAGALAGAAIGYALSAEEG